MTVYHFSELMNISVTKTKGWKTVPLLTSEYAQRGFDDLHSCESWGRFLIQIMIRLCGNINCWAIDQSLKTLYETTKQSITVKILKFIGVDISMDITGGGAQKFFLKQNHDKIVSIVPDSCHQDFAHFLSEATFFLGVMCHPDPKSVFDLEEVEHRLKAFQVFIIETFPNFDQPPYVHMGLMHLIQLIKSGKKSISSYGTQNKEAKNKMQRDCMLFRTLFYGTLWLPVLLCEAKE